MSTLCACGSVAEGENFMAGTSCHSCMENESPPEKKLKLEGEDNKDDLKVEDEIGSVLKVEDETGSDLKVENGDGDKEEKEDSSGYDSDDWSTWPNKDVFIKYFQQLHESDGFDFDEYPGSCMYAPIYPILEFELFPEFVDRIKSYASLAIKQYFSEDGKERTVTEIVKINAGCPRDFTYYITFKINNEGNEETFQAKVARTIERTLEILICRRKNDRDSNLQVQGCRTCC